LGLDAVYWVRMTEEGYLSPETGGDLSDWYEAQVS